VRCLQGYFGYIAINQLVRTGAHIDAATYRFDYSGILECPHLMPADADVKGLPIPEHDWKPIQLSSCHGSPSSESA
jgi:hypothetical protein